MSSVAVFGLGQLGHAIATYLAENGVEVIAIDRDLTRVEAIKDQVTRALAMDTTDEKALRAAGVADCRTVVLAFGEDELEGSVLTAMILREIGVGRIISRAATDIQAKVLERLGVTKVIFPERQIGIQVARNILAPSVHELVPISAGTSLAELEINSKLGGKTLGELQLRAEYGLNAVAIHRREVTALDDGSIEKREVVDNLPGPQSELRTGDILVVVGADEKIREFAGHAC